MHDLGSRRMSNPTSSVSMPRSSKLVPSVVEQVYQNEKNFKMYQDKVSAQTIRKRGSSSK